MALFNPYVAIFRNQNNWQHGSVCVCAEQCGSVDCGGTRNPWWKEAAFLTGRKLDQERSSKHHHYHHHRQARPIFFGEFCSLHIRTYLVGEINILLIIHFERVCASRISLGYFLHVDFFPSLIDAIYIWVSQLPPLPSHRNWTILICGEYLLNSIAESFNVNILKFVSYTSLLLCVI